VIIAGAPFHKLNETPYMVGVESHFKMTEAKKCPLMHELLNELTIIIGECELLKECEGDRERVEAVMESANKMSALVMAHNCTNERQRLEAERYEQLVKLYPRNCQNLP
jgi:hypothetical protein